MYYGLTVKSVLMNMNSLAKLARGKTRSRVITVNPEAVTYIKVKTDFVNRISFGVSDLISQLKLSLYWFEDS